VDSKSSRSIICGYPGTDKFSQRIGDDLGIRPGDDWDTTSLILPPLLVATTMPRRQIIACSKLQNLPE